MNVNLNGYQQPNGSATLPPSVQALEAIVNNNYERLDVLIEAGEIDAGTRTENGTTLLMEAARHCNAHALLALSEQLPLNALQAVDSGGNNVTHYIVEYTDNAVFEGDDELNDADQLWRDGLAGFLQDYAVNSGYDMANFQGITPTDRAVELEKADFTDFLSVFLS